MMLIQQFWCDADMNFPFSPSPLVLYSDPGGCVDLATFTSLSEKVIDLSSASISYTPVLSKADKY